MSGNQELPPLRIRPRPSRILAVLLLVTHGAALSALVALPLDWYWRVGLGALVIASLVDTLGTQVLFTIPRGVREAIWGADGTWTLILVSGERVEARLLPSTLVTTRLLVLNFRCGLWRFRALTLPPDALAPDLLRRLRVRLRLWGAADRSDAR
ncbi:MAG: hypothetical protein LGR52_10655 [Candidatus Thiosymbion ectosymbiont of Robbea hypermnestra]|nr:hypothetical protein [Candidatus Thiosymbion ectosymbiont of Robbea hypermnestra]